LMIIFYGARLPRTSAPENAPTTALTRSELLMRLNALADDTRLKMLKLLTEREEICAQDFINELNLSQSSTSRHLRQLTASGYVNERRRDVAKCYSLNHERVEDTLNALARYLQTQ
jgi:DNA-binding transcriptional ArsR family regulator